MYGDWLKGGMILVLLLAWLTGTAGERPRVAIVIDDMGFQEDIDQAIMALDERITIAIIPEAPMATRLARQAGRQRRDVLIHLPLSGLDHDNCEPVLTCMGADWSVEAMHDHLAAAFDRVGGAIGINNHQGSRFTADREAVANLVAGLDQLERRLNRALIVLDSRTSPTTLLETKARNAGLVTARRHVFLDHSNSTEDIEQAWDALVAMARERGQAVAIGHPRINTLKVLQRRLPELESHGVELMSVSQLACPAPPAGLLDLSNGCGLPTRPAQAKYQDASSRSRSGVSE